SHAGLEDDLARCLRDLDSGGVVAPFRIAQRDVSDRFLVPQAMLGRGPQCAALEAAFEAAASGRLEVVAILGRPGIGKTALVQELHKPLAARAGWYTTGKFDPHKRDAPYRTLAATLGDLTRAAMGQRADAVEALRVRARHLVEPLGRAVIDLVPEAAWLLGPQPELQDLPAAEAQQRVRTALGAYLGAFAVPERPLVLFLDDVQWADTASIDFLRWLATAGEVRATLLLLAWRDSEVDPGHPLHAALEAMAAAGRAPREVRLVGLDLPTVETIVAGTLRTAVTACRDLAGRIHARTDGNPFFVIELLHTLHRNGAIRFDGSAAKWRSDAAAVDLLGIADDVVDLMHARLDQLPAEARDIVTTAACIGHVIDFARLGQVTGLEPAEAARRLWPALQEGLLLPVGDDYKYLADATAAGTARVRFVHDRVRQAALVHVDADTVARRHAVIGQLLRAGRANEHLGEDLFDVAHHLNASRTLVTEPAARRDLAWLNLRAGERARGAAAFDAARAAFATGVELLGPDSWTDPELARRLHVGRGESAWLAGRFDEAEQAFDILRQHATTPDQRAEVANLEVLMHTTRGDNARVIETGLKGLAALGVPLPRHPGKGAVAMALLRVKWLLRGKKPADLAALPEMTEAGPARALRIMSDMSTATYNTDQNLMALCILTMMRLCLRYGNSPNAANVYVLYGMIVGPGMGDLAGGHAFGELSLSVAERYGHRLLLGRCRFSMAAILNHWRRPAHSNLALLQQARVDAQQSGDLNYVLYCCNHITMNQIVLGESLDIVAKTAAEHLALAERVGYHDCALIYRSALAWATVLKLGPLPLGAAAGQRTALVGDLEKTPFVVARTTWHVLQLQLAWLAGDLDLAAAELRNAEAVLHGGFGQLLIGEFHLYAALTEAAQSGQLRGYPALLARRRARRHLKKLSRWATHAPANFRPKALLVEAELVAATGDVDGAMPLLAEAGRAAAEASYRNLEAIARLRIARLALATGRLEPVVDVLSVARSALLQWGAGALVQTLDTVAATHSDVTVHMQQRSLSGGFDPTTVQRVGDLDLQSILKASRALSGEIVLDKLLDRIIRIVVENAGAERGVLVLDGDGGPTVGASWELATDGPVAPSGQALEACAALPVQTVRYALQTGEPVVHADASADGVTSLAAKTPIRSLLCLPLQAQGRAAGVVYLENNLARGAFTAERIEVVRLLAAQATVSLHNARLYDEQRKLATALVRFVPSQFLESLGRRGIADVVTGDAVRGEMTVMFSDIRGFTSRSERMPAEDLIRLLNDYLAKVGPCIHSHGGFIDKFIGDAVMALFPGAPDNAVGAAVAMADAVRALNIDLRGQGHEPLHIGVGLNRGDVMLGTVGWSERLDTTVIGDPVNTAARLEATTKHTGTTVLVSDSLRRSLDDPRRFAMRSLGGIKVAGKQRPVLMWEVVDADEPERRARKAAALWHWEGGLLAWRARTFDEAALEFEGWLREVPGDKAGIAYLRACRSLAQGGGLAADWDEGIDLRGGEEK
ncbi:MAG: GAF domain-containing protein, partial [Myxococcales bacterium]|nr:GAF domain-containing protein [Myxococcales bacterium]